MSNDSQYGLSEERTGQHVKAPALDYRPRKPQSDHSIGLIGCGAVTQFHLAAYQRAGFNVVALCDPQAERALERQTQYYPEATVYTDARELLDRTDIEVVDIATQPQHRMPLIEGALDAGKHVLSQKPFALDLDVAESLVEKAESLQLQIAVNQNGRWAPYFSYLLQAVQAGLIGNLHSADFVMHFDHNWTAGTHFDHVHHLLLYDFAIHFFDAACMFFAPRPPLTVFSELCRSPSQQSIPPLMATSVATFEGGLASFVFGGNTRFGQRDETILVGDRGTLRSAGGSLNEKQVTLCTDKGKGEACLEGTWFEQGFEGTMAELLFAIEEGREPANSARNNLVSLALTFAAVASADSRSPQTPGQVRRLEANRKSARISS